MVSGVSVTDRRGIVQMAPSNNLTLSWYVLHTKSRFENVVLEGLTRKAITAFLPRIRVRSKRRDRRMTIRVPLFPGYVFVQTDLHPHHHIDILKTAGAVRLIGNRDGPVFVPEETVESLRIMTSIDHDIKTGSRFHKGDRVLVIRGPFAGVTGTFNRYSGGDRIIVNIEALGQYASVDVDQEDVEVLPSLIT
jgi:transcriptional antiterminator NusG